MAIEVMKAASADTGGGERGRNVDDEITYRAALLRGTTEVERISRGGQNCTRAPSLPTGSLNKAKKAVAEPPTAMERIAELVEHQRKMEERLANMEK